MTTPHYFLKLAGDTDEVQEGFLIKEAEIKN